MVSRVLLTLRTAPANALPTRLGRTARVLDRT